MVPAAFTMMDAFPLSPEWKGRSPGTACAFVCGKCEAGAAPRDVVEQRLTAIWERILDIRPVGVRDNFFSLGGHSLTALRLMAEIERDFSIRLPVSVLFQSPTIESLAPMLRQQSELSSPAVPIQKGDGRAPLFFVPGGGGNMVYLTELARLLGVRPNALRHAISGAGWRGSAGCKRRDHRRPYARSDPDGAAVGPYRLGGHCFGGLDRLRNSAPTLASGPAGGTPGYCQYTCASGASRGAGSRPGQARWIETIAHAWEEVAGKPVPVSASDLDGLDEEAQLQVLRQRDGLCGPSACGSRCQLHPRTRQCLQGQQSGPLSSR